MAKKFRMGKKRSRFFSTKKEAQAYVKFLESKGFEGRLTKLK